MWSSVTLRSFLARETEFENNWILLLQVLQKLCFLARESARERRDTAPPSASKGVQKLFFDAIHMRDTAPPSASKLVQNGVLGAES